MHIVRAGEQAREPVPFDPFVHGSYQTQRADESGDGILGEIHGTGRR